MPYAVYVVKLYFMQCYFMQNFFYEGGIILIQPPPKMTKGGNFIKNRQNCEKMGEIWLIYKIVS